MYSLTIDDRKGAVMHVQTFEKETALISDNKTRVNKYKLTHKTSLSRQRLIQIYCCNVLL